MATVTEDTFGTCVDPHKGAETVVRRFTFTNKRGESLQVINYGATITSICVLDKQGQLGDVNLWYDGMEGYKSSAVQVYFGAIVGRVANRIGKGKFSIDGQEYQVSTNRGQNHLHGGNIGFDKVLWDAHVDGDKVVFSYLSKDGEEGYPGQVLAHVTYSLSDESEVCVRMVATASKPTPINLANHAYFNLAGHTSGSAGVYQHKILINADHITAVDEESIPTGALLPVAGTPFDLRGEPRLLKDAMPRAPGGGFDHNFCVNVLKPDEKTFVARVEHPGTGRVLEVFSDQPGVQFYTSNFFPEDDSLRGKGGVFYKKHAAFCLETQKYPDSVNHPEFPSSIVRPGKDYTHDVTYKFSTVK